ncbi:MAG: hypothetical protein EP329_17585 [Deltaproteobacteria bacterium]|nr:MAG: hypothetical protein EP329_17585 [Deltaproteobacteria bacterium]
MRRARPRPAGWDAGLLAALGPKGARLGYQLEVAQSEHDDALAARILAEAGDALALEGQGRSAALAFEEAVTHAERAGHARTLGDLYWRLGQVNEGLHRPAGAARWYDRAATVFADEGDTADQVMALQASARCRVMTEGPAEALRVLQDAIDLARAEDDGVLLAAAMEQAAEAAAALSYATDALAKYREAVRLYTRENDDFGRVRCTIGAAECELELGDHVRAIHTLAPVETELELGLDDATAGRGLALTARFYLEAGDRERASELFEKALDLLGRGGAIGRRAHLVLAFGRVLERTDGPQRARPLYEAALADYERIKDRSRIGPAAYSLARCYFDAGDVVRADEAIDRALDVSQRLGDVEGLELCTELAVRIAVSMGQGKLALDRLRLAARVKGELGDYAGEVRYLLRALDATLAIPGLDPVVLADEFIEAVRRSGTRFLSADELDAIAEKLAKAERPDYAREITVLRAQSELDAGRAADAAEAFARAAGFAVRADAREEAGELWDQAIAIGTRIGLKEVGNWRIDRDMFGHRE